MRKILLALLLLGLPLFGEVSQEVVQALIPKLNTQRIESPFR